MKATRNIFVFLALSLVAGQAQAQFVVKRVKCAEAVRPTGIGVPDHIFHYNPSDTTKSITVQITRDGCRPKPGTSTQEFTIYATTVSNALLDYAGMLRLGKHVSTATLPIANNAVGFVAFEPLEAGTISGTFDYVYSIQ